MSIKNWPAQERPREKLLERERSIQRQVSEGARFCISYDFN